MRSAISNHHLNPHPGEVPEPIFDVCGVHDGTKHHISRPFSAHGEPDIQNAYYSRYVHAHINQWAGTCFPDGMIILDGPYPGHYVDPSAWRESETRRLLIELNDQRIDDGQRPLKLLGDKIYASSREMHAMCSNRGGPMLPWQEVVNSLCSPFRVPVEWLFGLNMSRNRFLDLDTAMKLRESPISVYYINAVFLTNCRTCLDRTNICAEKFGVDPPTLREYLHQPPVA